MYQQTRSYQNAIVTCQSKRGSTNVGNIVSTLSSKDMEEATSQVLTGSTPSNPNVKDLLSSVKASCRSLGHSNEAAKVARCKLF